MAVAPHADTAPPIPPLDRGLMFLSNVLTKFVGVALRSALLEVIRAAQLQFPQVIGVFPRRMRLTSEFKKMLLIISIGYQ